MPKRKSRLKTKPQMKPRKIREPRTVIIAFRLRKSEADLLLRNLKDSPIAGVKSLKQFSRKLTIDHAKGRTVYVDALDRQIEPDAREKLNYPAPDSRLKNEAFVKAMLAYLTTEEDWNRLRLFMLQAGWSPKAIDSYRQAQNEMERMTVVTEVLREMI